MKKMIMKAALLLAAALALPMSANAAVLWNWTWTGAEQNNSGSGTLTTKDLDSDGLSDPSVPFYEVTDIEGTMFFEYDSYEFQIVGVDTSRGVSKLLNSTPQLSFQGIYFLYDDDFGSGQQASFFYYSPYSTYVVGESLGTFTATQVSPVPEPETYALMLAGLGLVGFMARRRKSK